MSPSKTQSFLSQRKDNEINLSKETLNLFAIIKKLSKEKLAKVLKIKGKLLEETFANYQSDFSDKPIAKAIESYTGVVFEQLDLLDYNDKQTDYMMKNLRILSAMYGVLSPDDLIHPYRLDLTIKLPKINLYDYWQEKMDYYFKDEELVINLASNEFSKMLKNYVGRTIDIEFYEKTKDNQLKTISYNAKKCRGQMLNFLIKNQVEDITLIKKFSFDGYIYSSDLSKPNKLIFIRQK